MLAQLLVGFLYGLHVMCNGRDLLLFLRPKMCTDGLVECMVVFMRLIDQLTLLESVRDRRIIMPLLRIQIIIIRTAGIVFINNYKSGLIVQL